MDKKDKKLYRTFYSFPVLTPLSARVFTAILTKFPFRLLLSQFGEISFVSYIRVRYLRKLHKRINRENPLIYVRFDVLRYSWLHYFLQFWKHFCLIHKVGTYINTYSINDQRNRSHKQRQSNGFWYKAFIFVLWICSPISYVRNRKTI